MTFELTAPDTRLPVVIMVSKADHCLNDLLYRYRTGQLPVEIRAVVSNHPDLEPLVAWHDIPYHLASEKGVKLVGATAHSINDDLDEGPIITQGVESVSHADCPEDLVVKARDVECRFP